MIQSSNTSFTDRNLSLNICKNVVTNFLCKFSVKTDVYGEITTESLGTGHQEALI